MIDLRLYRAALLPALAAVVVLLFSFQPIADPVEPGLAPTAFDEQRAATLAKRIAETSRAPGSEGDAEVADLVARRFAEIKAGEPSEQPYESSFEGDDVELRNVILTLPAESQRILLVIAGRDSSRGPGAASSAAATAALLEIAAGLGTSEHGKTIVIASTDGASDGASGARQLIGSFPDPDLIDAAIVVAQPGATDPRPPHVVATSTGEGSPSIQLVRSAQRAVSDQAGRPAGLAGTLGELVRLAVPSGLGEQAPLLEAGIDAVAISSAGEAPLDSDDDQPADLSASSLGDFGRSALDLALALDRAPAPLEHGPDAYVRLAGNLVPGWALSVLVLALLLPAVVAAVDAAARAARRREGARVAITRTAAFSLPPLAGLLALYVLTLIGLVPDARFPFDPGRFGVGIGAIAIVVVLIAATVAVTRATTWARTPGWAEPEALAAGIGLLSALTALAVWLVNPYLALLVAPLAHAWVPAARSGARLSWLAASALLVAALIPLAGALIHLASSIGLGAGAPWHLLLMVADGQIEPLVAACSCILAGCVAALVTMPHAPQAPPEAQPGWTEVVSREPGSATINEPVTPPSE